MGDIQMTHGLHDVTPLFADAEVPWGIAGGWAIDLHLGDLDRRPHSDVDVVWPFSAEDALKDSLAGWDLHRVVQGVREPWTGALAPAHQIWVRPDPDADWAFEVMFEDLDSDHWTFRRNRSITFPSSDYLVERLGIPTVDLAITLLWKAVRADDQDHRDLLDSVHLLDDTRRAWLREAVRTTHGDDHRWVNVLR